MSGSLDVYFDAHLLFGFVYKRALISKAVVSLIILFIIFLPLFQFLSKNGIYEFWNWFDDRTWYDFQDNLNLSLFFPSYLQAHYCVHLGIPLGVLLVALSILV